MAEAHLAEPCRGARRPLHNVGFDPKPPLISVEGSDGLCPLGDLAHTAGERPRREEAVIRFPRDFLEGACQIRTLIADEIELKSSGLGTEFAEQRAAAVRSGCRTLW